MQLTANEIYNKLINDERILAQTGKIYFDFGTVKITVKQRDVIGNLIQEWLENWLKINNIEFLTNENSQMPPDFYLSPNNKTDNLLEIKAFNIEASPGFDIADFTMFSDELINKPYVLNSYYLIFGYKMTEEGIITIQNLWLKKIWEILCSSNDWALKLQVQKNVVHKIRPATWYSNKTKFPTFENKEDFLSALEEVVHNNPKTHHTAGLWKNKFCKAYKKFYGQAISIPRWEDIKYKYCKT